MDKGGYKLKFFRFDREVRRVISAFNSYNVGITPIIKNEGYTSVGCMHFDKESILGMHAATGPQLFLVISGEGWVCIEGEEKVPVSTGTAVFWVTGEQHESGTETGMAAMIIEGPNLDPYKYLEGLE
jgi:quercetin dioxygenase-like cupin family protein